MTEFFITLVVIVGVTALVGLAWAVRAWTTRERSRPASLAVDETRRAQLRSLAAADYGKRFTQHRRNGKS